MAKSATKRSSKVSRSQKTVQEKNEIIEKKFAYQLEIELEDYLFFASNEKGKVVETSLLLHNYALAYAFGWVSAPYYHEYQAAQYDIHLQQLNEQGIYIYPASAHQATHCLMQYNTVAEHYMMAREQSLGFPNWGFIKCIRPGAVFETYVLSNEEVNVPSRIRLGKWMSQATVTAKSVSLRKTQHSESPHLLNVADLDELPIQYNSLYHMLPTRLIRQVIWAEPVEGYALEDEKQSVFLPEADFTRRIFR